MSFKEVTALRRAGNLREAYEMAKQDLSEEHSEWTLSAMYWVVRDYCLYYIQNGQNANAKNCLNEMLLYLQQMDDYDGVAKNAYQKLCKQLDPNVQIIQVLSEKSKQSGQEQEAYETLKGLLQDDLSNTLHEDAGWIIYRYLKANIQTCGLSNANEAIALYLNLRNIRPSLLHSQMLILATQIRDVYPDFDLLLFIREWDVEDFASDDYYRSYYNENERAPLVDRIIEKCFRYGYALQSIIDTFSSSKIDEDLITLCYSRWSFFEIDKLKDGDVQKMFDRMSIYLETINALPIKNEFHSRILSYILWKLPEDDKISYFPQILEHWGMNNFREEDWKKEQKEDKTFPSLAERAIAKCIDAYKINRFKDVTEEFESLLKEAVHRKSDDEQLSRNLGITLFSLGKKEEALYIYKSLLLQLNTFYVWKELAVIADDIQLKVSALCKALIIEKNENFLGEIHLQLAELLIDSHLYANARGELETYYNTYIKNHWRISDLYSQLAKQIPSNIVAANNNDFYISHQDVADEFIYSDIEWTPMIVTDVYSKEDGKKAIKKARLCASNGVSVAMNLDTLRKRIQQDITIGMCVDAKLVSNENGYRCVLCRASESKISDVFKKVVGYIDYHNTEKKCYTILGNNFRQYIIYSSLELESKSYCICYEIPEVEHDSTKPYKAIFFQTIDPITAISEFPFRTAVVDNVNEEKQLFHCVFGRGLDIVVHNNETLLRPSVGDYVDIKYVLSIREGKRKRKMIGIRAASDSKLELRKQGIQGTIRLNTNMYGEVFGFVGDYYVPARLIEIPENAMIQSGDQVLIDVLFNGEKWQTYKLQCIGKNE